MPSNALNLIGLKPGDVVRMVDGSIVRVQENPGDGVWIFGFILNDAGETPEIEEAVFAQDVAELVSTA